MKELLTESRLKAFRRCPREHHYRYVLGYRPISEGDAVKLGSLVHLALEEWWKGSNIEDALAAMLGFEVDAYERVRAEEMVRGYDARWGDERANYDDVSIEEEFRRPLINPETGSPSRTFDRAGKFDVRCRLAGRKLLIEHKTASSAEANYWERLSLDGQVSGYLKASGCDAVVYDVLVKPGLRPLKATPLESRKYKKGTSELYANQRDTDESPEEFRLRVREEIAANPDTYYQRAEIVRLESEIERHDLETWHQALVMREQRRLNIAPMNTDACIRFGQKCSYFDVCCQTASLDDESRFVRLSWPHPELQPSKEEKENDHEHESAQAG